MSNDPNERFSDLQLARSIARRLRGHCAPSGAPRAVSHGPRYVRFDSRRIAAGAVGSIPSPDGEGRWASDNWNQFLDDCRQICRAKGAFVMDEHGLVVSVRGLDDGEALEVLGARLTVTFQQADRMSHHAEGPGTVCVELAEGWLTGLKYAVPGAGALIVGVMADAPVCGERKTEVVEFLRRAVSSLG
ncbi:MAG: hypothetical protein JW940_22660 [Polyangiaceae bacterium]|nr:hypothetical protein [Polyangiaceae bacterium]